MEGNFGVGDKRQNDELNDANESLKLLKLKMGSNEGIGSNNNLGGNNENYRKPFKPGMGDLDKNLININTNKNAFDSNAISSKRDNTLGNPSSTINNNNLNRNNVNK